MTCCSVIGNVFDPYIGTMSLHFVQYEQHKRKQHTDSPDEASNQSVPPPPKKACRRDFVSKAKDKLKFKADADVDVRTFTVYLQVWSTETITEPKQSSKTAQTTTMKTSDIKGPFEFDTSRDFDAFRREVASTLACNEDLLPISEFEWEFDNESNWTLRKNLTNSVGFDALVEAVKRARVTNNVVVWLHLPKPGNDEEVYH